MSTWEPDGWNFSDSGVKLHVYGTDDDSDSSSSGDVSGDDQLFTTKKLCTKKYQKKSCYPNK